MRTTKNIIKLRKQARNIKIVAVLSLISSFILPYLMVRNCNEPFFAVLLFIMLLSSSIIFACSATEIQADADQAQRILNY